MNALVLGIVATRFYFLAGAARRDLDTGRWITDRNRIAGRESFQQSFIEQRIRNLCCWIVGRHILVVVPPTALGGKKNGEQQRGILDAFHRMRLTAIEVQPLTGQELD